MVAKIDEAEAYAPLYKVFRFTLYAGLVGLVILFGLVILISRSLTKPLVSLSRVATEVESGNLSARASDISNDEVGLLAMSFNSMVARMQSWHTELGEQVDARTSELNKKNEELNTEIAERKEAQEALRISDERWQFAIEGSGDGIWDWNALTNQVFYSDRWKQILGYEPDKIGDQIDEWICRLHVDEKKDTLTKIDELLDGTTDEFRLEHRLLCEDGSYKWVLGRGMVVSRSEAGQAVRVIGTMSDITKSKQAEEALLQSEEKFRRITERSFDVIMMADLDGTITYTSPSVERVLGYRPDDINGKSVIDLTPEQYVLSVIKIFLQTSEGLSITGFKSALYRKDGSIADVEVDATPIFKDGKVIGSQGIIRDITETKRLQDLEFRAQRLEAAGQVAGQVAHDFNNLLGPLMAYPEFIRDELPKDHPALPYLTDMENSAAQIAEINQQLLTLGRRGHYNQEPLNLNEIVMEAAREQGQLPSELVLETRLDANLMNIMAGRAQIYRVISNLINNARDAMQDIGRIYIETENYYVDDVSTAYGQVPKGEFVKLTVSDTGHGIPDDEIQRIFDPFYTTKDADKRRGSGLGLSVVDAVMKDHGGFIDLSSKQGEGTSFYLYFPITRDEVESMDTGNVVGGSEKILVVDDDKVQREVSLKLLLKLGYDTTSVSSGKEAIAFLEDNPRDLLILDMIMPPGIDGTETYRRALMINPSQKAIIVSGFAESERVQIMLKLGAGTFVRKPLTMSVLAAAIRTELDRKTALPTTQLSPSV